MKSQRKLSIAYKLNIITFICITFSVVWMFSGLHYGEAEVMLASKRFAMLKYYTVDSNILMAFIALYAARKEKAILVGKSTELPSKVLILKLLGAVGVTLTMLVTCGFLVPTMGFHTCFNNSNMFLHLINPVISIVTFLYFEASSQIPFKHTFTGIISMLIYAAIYVILCVSHAVDGQVPRSYDWYGFFGLGVESAIFIAPLLVLFTYLISFLLWKANRRFA